MTAQLGAPVVKWLEVELPKVQNLQPDLLGEMSDGTLVHIELHYQRCGYTVAHSRVQNRSASETG